MLNVIKAGSATNTSVTVSQSTGAVMVMPSGGAGTVVLNGQTVTLPTTLVDYVTIPGDYPTFSVTGTVLYIVLG